MTLNLQKSFKEALLAYLAILMALLHLEKLAFTSIF
jgi:hypothetical protein